jgi:hypothetical protein
MKVFISQPMRGKTDDEILTVRQEIIAEIERIYTSDDGGIPCVKVIDSFFQDAPTAAKPLWFLGRSLQLMSTADVVVFAPGWEGTRGCKIEQMCAESYGLTWIDGEELLPNDKGHLGKIAGVEVYETKPEKKCETCGAWSREIMCGGLVARYGKCAKARGRLKPAASSCDKWEMAK